MVYKYGAVFVVDVVIFGGIMLVMWGFGNGVGT